MADYRLEQSPDGVWRATSDDEDHRVTNVGGWDALAELIQDHTVRWDSPAALGRFRSQFGEPPATMDLRRMSVTDAG